MRPAERLFLFLKSLNPDQYPKLCAHYQLHELVRQWLLTFLGLLLTLFVLLVPASILQANTLATRAESFDTFNLSGEFSASGPIVLLEHPRIVADLQANATLSRERVLLTNEGISWKKWWYFGEAFRSWNDLRDPRGSGPSTYAAVLLFLAPSLAFWTGAFLLAKYAFLVLIFGSLAYLVPKLWRHSLSPMNAFKVSLLSSTVMMALEMLLFPFYRNGWLGPLLSLLFLVIGVMLVGDRVLVRKGHKV